MKNKVYCVPIWEATWTFQDKKGYSYNIDTIVKDIMKKRLLTMKS